MTSSIRNVFISHIHEDDQGLTDLKSLLKSKGMTARDYSINSDNPNQAKSHNYIWNEILRPRIDAAGVFLVYISPATRYSYWVNKEIEYAAKIGKRIIGVWENAASGCGLPQALDKYADAVVGWTGQKIIDAIEGRINNWETPNGSSIEPRAIARHLCG